MFRSSRAFKALLYSTSSSVKCWHSNISIFNCCRMPLALWGLILKIGTFGWDLCQNFLRKWFRFCLDVITKHSCDICGTIKGGMARLESRDGNPLWKISLMWVTVIWTDRWPFSRFWPGTCVPGLQKRDKNGKCIPRISLQLICQTLYEVVSTDFPCQNGAIRVPKSLCDVIRYL